MEPITTAVAAVAADSKAIEFIKARINDVQSVADISQQIGTLFECQKKLNDERNKQASVGDITFKSSIDAVLESKKLQEQMNDIRTLINMRLHGKKSLIYIIRNSGNKKRRKRKRDVKRFVRLKSLKKRLKRYSSSLVSS